MSTDSIKAGVKTTAKDGVTERRCWSRGLSVQHDVQDGGQNSVQYHTFPSGPQHLEKYQGRSVVGFTRTHPSILPSIPPSDPLLLESLTVGYGKQTLESIRELQTRVNFNAAKGHRINNSFKMLPGIDCVIAL